MAGDYANTRYSALDQINKDNVKDLKVAWMHSLGSTHSQGKHTTDRRWYVVRQHLGRARLMCLRWTPKPVR